MKTEFPEINPAERILMGPGPSDVSARVLAALAKPTLGHLDPEYLAIMDDTRTMLQYVFQTTNELTLAMPGTGSAGMETCVANLVEPGDEVVIGVCGYFGARMVEMAERHGATVHRVEVPWGRSSIPRRSVQRSPITRKRRWWAWSRPKLRPARTSRLRRFRRWRTPRERCCWSMPSPRSGVLELRLDDWAIDACYSCSQKGLSSPPVWRP